MEDDSILDSQLTASSEYNPNHGPHLARLDAVAGAGIGGWAALTLDSNQWIQVDFDGTLKTVSGIITQGRQDYAQWVTEYRVQYSNDGVNWKYVKDEDNLDAVSVNKALQMGLHC